MMGQIVVDKAREYLNTPYLHQGRLKGQGVDCIGLVICVAHELGLSDFDCADYARTPNKEMLLTLSQEQMKRIDAIEAKPGDVALFRILKQPQHFGILGNYYRDNALSLIHAYSSVGKVVETYFSPQWGARAIAYFRLPGVE